MLQARCWSEVETTAAAGERGTENDGPMDSSMPEMYP
jgi:hypothetical protein